MQISAFAGMTSDHMSPWSAEKRRIIFFCDGFKVLKYYRLCGKN